MYPLLRKALFTLSAESAHDFTLDMLGAAERTKLLGLFFPGIEACPVEVLGLKFDNPVGLAAGLDKNGECIDAFGKLGFGFIEVGTVTPRPQPGNPHPRIFRLPEANGIINRMGFNNKGVDHLVAQVQKRKWKGVLGINIGKNFDTPVEDANSDYLIGMEKVYDYADYIAVNLSSPNTPGLRSLQFGESLKSLLGDLKDKQQALAQERGKTVPVLVKVAPDMTDEEIHETADIIVSSGMDGVIGTNTTVSREMVAGLRNADETGGLSGAPLFELSTQKLKVLSEAVNDRIPIIGVGGIHKGSDAKEKMLAGAQLVQIYTGFIYEGPKLIKECVEELRSVLNG